MDEHIDPNGTAGSVNKSGGWSTVGHLAGAGFAPFHPDCTYRESLQLGEMGAESVSFAAAFYSLLYLR